MDTIESLRKKMKGAQDLQTIVKTMKALAAVNIRQYEKAVISVSEYYRTIEMGMRVALQKGPRRVGRKKAARTGNLNAVVFGSDQGMCGPLNDQIVSHALKTMDAEGISKERRTIIAVGARAAVRLEDSGQEIADYFQVPSSASGIPSQVQEMFIRLEKWTDRQEIDKLVLFYCRPVSGASYRPHTLNLLPLDEEKLRSIENREWPSKVLPTFSMDWDKLFSALIREYLFISLCRAFAESSASENAGRLSSMQGAEKSIEERLNDLTGRYYQQRQESITEELLDIISGFEALKD
ncbi:MAG: F0F1 ATP synthase subunit gamma [Syntrophobacteraceae bacterium]